jgi:hypothetical protein
MNNTMNNTANKKPLNIYTPNGTLLAKSHNHVYNRVFTPKECDFIYFSGRIKSKSTGIKLVDKNTTDENIKNAYELSIKYNKPLIYYCGGDIPPSIFPNYPNIYVLNTSVNSSLKPSNEYVAGVVVKDKFSNFIDTENIKLTIGFVGQKLCGRQKYLDQLLNSKYNGKDKELQANFIIRDEYIHKLRNVHIRDFDNNMISNLFTFCYRGRGNFSVRFYETLMHGRIPIVIKTHNEFPFEDTIDYTQVGLFVNEEYLIKSGKNIDEFIIEYYNNKTKEELLQIQKNNRQLYLNYFHDKTYFEQIFTYFDKIKIIY